MSKDAYQTEMENTKWKENNTYLRGSCRSKEDMSCKGVEDGEVGEEELEEFTSSCSSSSLMVLELLQELEILWWWWLKSWTITICSSMIICGLKRDSTSKLIIINQKPIFSSDISSQQYTIQFCIYNFWQKTILIIFKINPKVFKC